MIEWKNRFVTTLEPNEVFVFGSNAQGFHGAGSAGLACRGDARNNWRNDQDFRALMLLANKPQLNPDLRGKWAIFGKARGVQHGREGRSYAIQTVTRPGAKQSVSRREIYHQLAVLWDFAAKHPQTVFVISPIGEGYAGWSREEMNEVWEFLIAKHGERSNVEFVRPQRNNYS